RPSLALLPIVAGENAAASSRGPRAPSRALAGPTRHFQIIASLTPSPLRWGGADVPVVMEEVSRIIFPLERREPVIALEVGGFHRRLIVRAQVVDIGSFARPPLHGSPGVAHPFNLCLRHPRVIPARVKKVGELARRSPEWCRVLVHATDLAMHIVSHPDGTARRRLPRCGGHLFNGLVTQFLERSTSPIVVSRPALFWRRRPLTQERAQTNQTVGEASVGDSINGICDGRAKRPERAQDTPALHRLATPTGNRHHRRLRREKDVNLNREFILSGLHEISIETKKPPNLDAVSQRATEHLVDSMELVIQRRDNPEIAAAPAESPQQVGIFGGAGAEHFPFSRDEVCADQMIAGGAILS